LLLPSCFLIFPERRTKNKWNPNLASRNLPQIVYVSHFYKELKPSKDILVPNHPFQWWRIKTNAQFDHGTSLIASLPPPTTRTVEAGLPSQPPPLYLTSSKDSVVVSIKNFHRYDRQGPNTFPSTSVHPPPLPEAHRRPIPPPPLSHPPQESKSFSVQF